MGAVIEGSFRRPAGPALLSLRFACSQVGSWCVDPLTEVRKCREQLNSAPATRHVGSGLGGLGAWVSSSRMLNLTGTHGHTTCSPVPTRLPSPPFSGNDAQYNMDYILLRLNLSQSLIQEHPEGFMAVCLWLS